ncbi:MAG: serine/threonine-protein kinase, partial [Thermoanaerobaculia bacterium]
MKDIGKYKVFNTIGTGGMANIYLAEKKDTGEKVAIKEIIPQIAKDEEFIKRFVREVKIMQSLNHPNILPIYDACLGPEEYYIVMPYLSGGTLKEILNKVQRIPMDFSIFILQQIMKALEYAHHKGVIHRDLKPSNVMFSGDGTLYLTDFGVARASTLTQLTQTGEILGTPGYMSPEQVLGMPIDYRSDYFSFGIMAYELVTGINPFLTDNPITTMKQIVEYYPPGPMDINPALEPSLEDLILKLLKKKPEERISNGFEILENLLFYWKDKPSTTIREDFVEFLKNPEEILKKYEEAKKRALQEKWKFMVQ